MKQLTLRGFDPQLEKRLETFARSEGISLNRAALELMRRGVGLPGAKAAPPVIGDALDEFIGGWTPEQEREVLEPLKSLDQIDEDFWR
jgi:hypothetical protein